MTLQHKIYAGLIVAAMLFFGIIAADAWSNYKIGKLEKEVTNAKKEADSIQKSAVALEQKASEYKQNIEYIESKLAEIQASN
jgi:peptidoglycan hydrolase CwlO-like protein